MVYSIVEYKHFESALQLKRTLLGLLFVVCLGVCTSVKCGKGQMCVPSPEGDAPVCQCRLKCSRKEYKV